MKNPLTNKVLFLLLAFFGLSIGLKAQNVNIPDANFKSSLVSNSSINTNGDGEISVAEAAAYTGEIDVFYYSISDLTGIEAFTAITKLYCHDNSLTSLDVSANTALTTLACGNNPLTSLDVSANLALTSLYCSSNSLTSLNVSANTNLTSLSCYHNSLTSLNVSANTNLTSLICGENSITSLDVSANTGLVKLDCHNNSLTSLNVSANTNLIILYCSSNSLTSLDVSANTALTHLDCGYNSLTSLEVSANTALTSLIFYENSITSLDVSANTALTSLYCDHNSLMSLDVKNGNNSNFTGFDVTNNPNLTCILVDDAAYMNSNWSGGKDAAASFNETACLQYAISAGVNPVNSGTINGAGDHYPGEYVSLTATANTGYTFTNWTENGTEVSKDATYSFMAMQDSAFIANFTPNSYTIAASVLPANSGTVTGAGTYDHGDNVSLTATANTGYTFTNWTENGTEVSTDATYIFTATKDDILVANFTSATGISDFNELNSFIIYPNPNTGTFALNFDNTYKGELNIKIYSATGAMVKELKVNKSSDRMSYSIDLGNITVGTYFVNISSTKEKITKTLIIK